MTWSARVSRADGSYPSTICEGQDDWSACQSCKHLGPCNVDKMAVNIGPILTSIDVGSDEHMASGEALLKCNGYELNEVDI